MGASNTELLPLPVRPSRPTYYSVEQWWARTCDHLAVLQVVVTEGGVLGRETALFLLRGLPNSRPMGLLVW